MSGRVPNPHSVSTLFLLALSLGLSGPPPSAVASPSLERESKAAPPQALRLERTIDRESLERMGIFRPTRLVYDASGNLYVLDVGRRRVAKVGPSGTPLFQLGGYGDDPTSFSLPSDLVIDRSQTLLVLDRGRNAIVAFDLQGHFLADRAVGSDLAAEAFDPAARLLVDSFGDLWILAARERDVIPLDDQLERARSSRFLSPEDSLGTPAAAAFLPDRGGWVLDLGARALRRFSPGGGLLGVAVWPVAGAPGACDLAADGGGFLYVADPAGQQVLVLDEERTIRLVRAFGGAEIPWHPSAIAVSRLDKIAVADPARGEIQILSIERSEHP